MELQTILFLSLIAAALGVIVTLIVDAILTRGVHKGNGVKTDTTKDFLSHPTKAFKKSRYNRRGV